MQDGKTHAYHHVGHGLCRCLLVIGWTLVAPSFALAQIPGQHPRIKPVPREPQYPEKSVVPEERRQNIVLPSAPPEFGEDPADRSGGGVGHVPKEMRRLPEGYVLATRPADIEHEGDWYVAKLAPVAGLPEAPPMRILPNSQLTSMETVLAGNPQSTGFNVSGRVTEFNGSNYVLLLDTRPMTRPTKPSTPPPAAPETVQGPSTTTPSTAPPHEPTAEEVVKQLMQNRPRRAILPPPQLPFGVADTQPSEIPLPEARKSRAAGRWTEDTTLADRAGRLVQGDGWWTFAFEDLSNTPQEKPIRLLPNQLLENAIHLSGGGSKSIVLIVSGDVAVHKSIDYLLLRKVMIRRDLGNFR